MLHVYDTLAFARQAHQNMARLNRGPFSIFEFFGNGKRQFAFWTN